MLHTMSIVRMAEEICQIYPNIDKGASAFREPFFMTWQKHGNLRLSKTGLVKGYSTEGELIGHLVKGAMYVENTQQTGLE